SGHTFVDNLRDRAFTPRNDGRAHGHGFNHHQAEWFWPVDWKEERQRISKKFALFLVADLTHEFNQRIVEERLDDMRKIFSIDRIDLCRDFERNSCALGDLNSPVRTFFRRDATKESEVVANFWIKGVEVGRQSMIDRCHPVD